MHTAQGIERRAEIASVGRGEGERASGETDYRCHRRLRPSGGGGEGSHDGRERHCQMGDATRHRPARSGTVSQTYRILSLPYPSKIYRIENVPYPSLTVPTVPIENAPYSVPIEKLLSPQTYYTQ